LKTFDAKAQRRKENQQQEFLWLLQTLLVQAGACFECAVKNLRRKGAKTQKENQQEFLRLDWFFFASLRLCVEDLVLPDSRKNK
jgi:hypothetical protein